MTPLRFIRNRLAAAAVVLLVAGCATVPAPTAGTAGFAECRPAATAVTPEAECPFAYGT
jgi:uncharacterized protein YceK